MVSLRGRQVSEEHRSRKVVAILCPRISTKTNDPWTERTKIATRNRSDFLLQGSISDPPEKIDKENPPKNKGFSLSGTPEFLGKETKDAQKKGSRTQEKERKSNKARVGG